jgi:hypothetical protein
MRLAGRGSIPVARLMVVTVSSNGFRKGSPLHAAGFTLCYGLLFCTPFSGGHNASAQAVTQLHWLSATRRPDPYRYWTSTSWQTTASGHTSDWSCGLGYQISEILFVQGSEFSPSGSLCCSEVSITLAVGVFSQVLLGISAA